MTDRVIAASEVFEINLNSENGKKYVAMINERIAALISNPMIREKLSEMRNSGKDDEQCRSWITMLAISTLFGLLKVEADEQYNYLAGKLRDMANECNGGT